MGDVIERLEWDSSFFGFEVARVSSGSLTNAEAREVALRCDADGIRCCYFLARAEDRASWAAATGAGFIPVDIRVELTRKKSAGEVCGSGVARLTRPGVPADESRLVEIAADAFRDSRFFADPRFGEKKGREMFAIWCRLGLSKAGLFTLAAVEDERLIGFVTGREAVDGKGRIDLFAVAAESRGKAVGRRLLRETIEEFWRRGAETIEVATQGSNVAAQRVYQDAGFRTASSSVWFHRWSS